MSFAVWLVSDFVFTPSAVRKLGVSLTIVTYVGQKIMSRMKGVCSFTAHTRFLSAEITRAYFL